MEIRKLNNSDADKIPEVSNIHFTILNESFLNNFGEKFLDIVYKNLLQSNNSILLASFENNKITGFLLALKDYSKFFKTSLSNQKLRLVFLIFKKILLKPILLWKIFVSLFTLSKEKPHAELQFIAVIKSEQGKNIGTKLMQELCVELKRSGINEYFVGTKSSNELSNRFYIKNNFTKSYTKKYFGDELNFYKSSPF